MSQKRASSPTASKRPRIQAAEPMKKGRITNKNREEERPSTTEAPPPPPPVAMPQQGSGKFVFPNGSIYAGEWQLIDDTKKRHGFGRLQFGKEVYIGEWKEDMIHGRGRFDFANGGSYEGEWEEGKYHGVGTYTWPSGALYSGEWRKGKMHGNGMLLTADGHQYNGRFHNDVFINAQGEWVAPNIGPSSTKAITTTTPTTATTSSLANTNGLSNDNGVPVPSAR